MSSRHPQGDGYNFARASQSAGRPSAQFGNSARSAPARRGQSAIGVQGHAATFQVREQVQYDRRDELTFRSDGQRLIREFRRDELRRPVVPKPLLLESQWGK